TTITRIDANGNSSTFFGNAGTPGLSGALGILKAGFVLVGSVPNNGTGGVLQGTLQLLDRSGNLLTTFAGLPVGAPWGLTVANDTGTTAQVFVANAITGTVWRINFSIPVGGVPSPVSATQIASGYQTRPDAAAFVVGPGGLAYDAASDTLYVASEAEKI